jgi:hypothetical protein
MKEYVKFNCHIMTSNEVNGTPEQLLEKYKSTRQNGFDYIFKGVECVVTSCSWAQGKTAIISKLDRKGDIDGIVCTEQKS